ncbi:DUF1592 domain-containing protein [Roseimaritima ulvae]|nr:DUF1592 domain-containing protein [Roseimaritima ulvae]
MNIFRIATLLVHCVVCPLMVDGADNPPTTLQAAKELGRANSSYLNEAAAEPAPTVDAPEANLSHFQSTIGPLLSKNCLACHGPETTESYLRVDELNPDLLSGSDIQKWIDIYDAVSSSEMPPEGESEGEFTDAQRRSVVEWLSAEIDKAALVRRNSTKGSSFRRMAKYEYSYVLQDLLGLSYSLADSLPPESASEDGFKNRSDMLQMSAMQFETYRQIGLRALRHATVQGERPQAIAYRIAMSDVLQQASGKDPKWFDAKKEQAKKRRYLLDRNTGKGLDYSGGTFNPVPEEQVADPPAVSPVVAALSRSGELKFNLGRFLPDEGIMRVRIRAGRTTMQENEYVSFRLVFGAHTSNNASFSQVISVRDVPVTASADEPQFVHFDIPLSEIPRNPFRKLTTTFPRRDEHLTIQCISNARGKQHPLQVLVDYIDIQAPFYEQWPPATHRGVFIDSPHDQVEQAYGREVLADFMERAWRRPVAATEVEPFLELFNEYRPSFASFEDAMLEVLATVLASPEFLYVTQRVPAGAEETDNGINDLELASRLSFFLWSSIPDDELLGLASQGKLSDPSVLRAQVERMLADPRCERLAQHFVSQWIGLEGLNSVTHVRDSSLKAAMQEEPVAFFREVLKDNRSVMDFLHSDYAVVNERLASHYKIPNVYGPHFRQVPLAPQAHRGGLLTTAAVLTMNSDGKDSHPLKRGVWLLERILHDPPPPPPPNVPEVDLTDPEILKMTLKERIADHRNKPACISCHAKIDPWGIAFENYDALGAFRTRIKDRPVDATSTLLNKQQLAGVEGVKRYLLSDRQDQFAKAMVDKLTAYALGRPLSFGDRAELDKLVGQFRKDGDRLGDLIHLIVQSDIFRAR